MPVKCGGCGKFLSAVDTARCAKCSAAYHRMCVGLPAKGPVVSSWHCPECRKNVRRDNKAETPVRGCMVEVQGEKPALTSVPTPLAGTMLESATPESSTILVCPTTPLSSAASPSHESTAAPSSPQSIATPSSAVVEPLERLGTPTVIGTAVVDTDGTASGMIPEFTQDVSSALKMVVEELRTLRFEVMELRKDVAELKASGDSCHTRIDGIESRLELLETRHNDGCDLSANLSAVECVVQQLKSDLNDRDQELMANDLVIANVPESPAENPTHLFQLVATKLGVALEDRDIISAERVGGRHIKATSPIACYYGAPGAT